MNSSSLSPLKPKSLIKQKQSPTTLPPISSPQPLKYQNDYESYQDELHEYKLQKAQQRQQSSVSLSSVSKSISGVSSSISSVSSPKKSQSKVMIQATKSTQKIVPYQDSPQFWQPTATTPYIQYSQHEQYKDISAQIIQQQIKEMRQHLIQMNRQLGQRLEHYHMGKTQFVVKELIKESKPQFYINQIQTNKKVQQAQINQLKKLNQTEFTVKDKDILLDLQQVLIQMRQQLHQLKKQQHDSKLKNHKQDILLQEIIRVNNDNKDNNAVKLLKLQIIYYMKKQAQLKIHEEHLDHEEKLIKENDKNLEKKVEEMRKDEKSKRYVYLLDDKWAENKKKYEQLLEKRKTLKKNIEAIKRSNDINEEKIAREMIELNNTYKTSIKPLMTKYQEDNEQIQSKINTIIQAYNLNEKALSNISYKFAEDTVTKSRSISQKPFFKGVLKSGFRAQNSSRLSSINDQSDQTSNEAFLTSLKKDNSYRYNDKNVATIDTSQFQQKQKVRSVSEMDGKLKPKGFRIGKNKDNNKSFSIAVGTQNHYKTLDASHNDINKMIDLPKMKMLKPKLLAPSTARTGKY